MDVAKQNILLVLQMAHLDTLEVRKTALEVIFDLLMWYGLQGFLDTECDNIESVLDSTLTDTYTQGLFCLKPFVYTSHLPLVYFMTFLQVAIRLLVSRVLILSWLSSANYWMIVI